MGLRQEVSKRSVLALHPSAIRGERSGCSQAGVGEASSLCTKLQDAEQTGTVRVRRLEFRGGE